MERFSFIFVVGGVLLFAFAFTTLGLGPWLVLDKTEVEPLQIDEVPWQFEEDYDSPEAYMDGLRHGRDIYVSEGCWHCHSQYVRPVGNEALYYGPVSTAGEYQNELQLPQLFGTRRVGPDLIRESNKHSKDWHFAHFYNPRNVVPESVMPSFPWYYTDDGEPTKDLVDLTAYVMWLGSWAEVPDELELERRAEGLP
ncbi:MAG: cytochrome-c oxidase [Deltaproteobacteria bacterium]|nr:MAG: cytochrome-c oxidase [Deltaproteobacteria bacterium]